jgi:tRNA pseudouridine55 synthase
MNTPDRGPHGLLIVDKPSGPTSHDVVAQARRRLGTRRVGHAGTLDPLATGVLVLLLGEATKLSGVATSDDKTYRAEVSFGRSTDSHDGQGATTAEAELQPGWLDEGALERALDVERRRAQQVPPVVSAIQVAGQRSYRLARSGNAPALEPRPVAVHSLTLLAWSLRMAELELQVSKGYYVRSLARDLGSTLGMPAHLSSLRRVRSGHFDVSEACAWPPPHPPRIIPLREALPRLVPIWRLTTPGVERARQGKSLSAIDFCEPLDVLEATMTRTVAWTDAAGTPVALGRRDGDVFRVQRGFTADAACGDADNQEPCRLVT